VREAIGRRWECGIGDGGGFGDGGRLRGKVGFYGLGRVFVVASAIFSRIQSLPRPPTLY
jgi:hypothetical protein